MQTTKIVPSYKDVKDSISWVGGPTGKLQRQHIPGYAGFIPHLASEGLVSKNYARTTAECLNDRIQNDEHRKTNYQAEFTKPNLRNTALQNTAENILVQLNKQTIADFRRQQKQYDSTPKAIEDVLPIDRVHIVGYQGYCPKYRHPLKQVTPPQAPVQQDLSKLTNEQLQAIIDKQDKGIPIVGYSGFQTKVKAENIFGLTFKDQTLESQT